MEREAADAKWQALHKDRPWHNGSFTSWAPHRSDEHPYHLSHGVVIGVAETDLRPDDAFLTDEDCGPPVRPTSTEPESEPEPEPDDEEARDGDPS